MTALPEVLTQLREAAKKATPGPWLRGTLSLQVFSAQKPICIAEANHLRDGQSIYREHEPRDNAEYIALCNPQNITMLLECVEESSEALKLLIEDVKKEYGPDFYLVRGNPSLRKARAVLTKWFGEPK